MRIKPTTTLTARRIYTQYISKKLAPFISPLPPDPEHRTEYGHKSENCFITQYIWSFVLVGFCRR